MNDSLFDEPAVRRALAVLVSLLVIWGFMWQLGQRLDPVGNYERPDQHYRLELLRKHSAWSHGTPLHPTEMPGVARLVDRSGKVLQERPVDLMKMNGMPEWRDRRVVLQPEVDWSLPD